MGGLAYIQKYGTVRYGNVSESWIRILLMMNVALWGWFVGDGVGWIFQSVVVYEYKISVRSF